MTKYSVILIIALFLGCSPRVPVKKEVSVPISYETIVGRQFKVLDNKVANSDRNFDAHYYLQVTGLINAESVLTDLQIKLESDGYRHVASTKNALPSLLHNRKTAKFIFYNDDKKKQVDLWFDRIFPTADRYLKGVDVTISIRVLTSNSPYPNTRGVKFRYTN